MVETLFPAGRKLRILPSRVNANKRPHCEMERANLERIVAEVKPGTVFYDVGGMEGEFTALFAGAFGAENIHIFEPAPWYWPNIRAVWEANVSGRPGGCFPGFVGDEVTLADHPSLRGAPRYEPGAWPPESDGPLRIGEGAFGSYGEHRHMYPTITLDAYAALSGVMPGAMLIDVEGAEGPVLAGAAEVLRVARPLVFVSVHPDAWQARHGWSFRRLRDYMIGAGYACQFISSDHETHLLFRPLDGA